MGINLGFTAITGATYTAAQYNTNVRDNWAAAWVGTAAGDIDYYNSPITKANLVKPSVLSLLSNDGSAGAGVFAWLAKSSVGGIHTSGAVYFSPDLDSPGAWTYVTASNVHLTLTATCTILQLFTVKSYSNTTATGRVTQIRPVIDYQYGSAPGNGSSNPIRIENQAGFLIAHGVPAGARDIWLEFNDDSGTHTHVVDGYNVAIAFAEP